MTTAALADRLAAALDSVRAGDARTQPVSTSLPAPLVDAFRALADAGVVPSLSAATTEALSRFGANLLLRLTLEEVYEEHPDARPSEDEVRAMAARLGVVLPDGPPDGPPDGAPDGSA